MCNCNPKGGIVALRLTTEMGGGAQGFPYLFSPPPERRNVMQVKDDKVVKDSGRTALARKNKSDPNAARGGHCSNPPQVERY